MESSERPEGKRRTVMKEIRELIRDMDRKERIDAIGSFFAFGGLFFICFMLSVMFG